MRNLAEIYRPTTISGAVDLLQQTTAKTAILAGGTSLLGLGDPGLEAVVDLAGIAELGEIRVDADTLYLGAMVKLDDLNTPAVAALAGGAISRAAAAATSSLLRRQATLGGSLLSGEAPELAVILIASGAHVTIYSPTASLHPLEALYLDGGLADRSLLTEVVIPRRQKLGFACHTVRRTPTDAPIVSVAAALTLTNGVVSQVGLSAGGIITPGPETPTVRRLPGWPLRLSAAEATLAGQTLSNLLITQAATAASAETPSISDYRASAAYRQAMVGVLLRRALGDAWRAALDVG